MQETSLQVTNGDIVCDPFVGTGSILIACAHFGAHVIGADINQQLLHGKGIEPNE